MKLDHTSLLANFYELKEEIEEYKLDITEKDEDIKFITDEISQLEDAAIEYHEETKLKLMKRVKTDRKFE